MVWDNYKWFDECFDGFSTLCLIDQIDPLEQWAILSQWSHKQLPKNHVDWRVVFGDQMVINLLVGENSDLNWVDHKPS